MFLESSLELVPGALQSHPEVLRSARRYEIPPSRMILDKSLHYKAMEGLEKKWKRGRPDILHTSLLVITDTHLFNLGLLDVYFHLLDGRVFKVSSETRLPRHLERFKGVMASLLKNNQVPPGSPKPLIYKVADSLSELLSNENSKLILLWEKGEPATLKEIVDDALKINSFIGIGAFPQGDFEEETLKAASQKYSIIGVGQLKAWGVAARLLCSIEEALGPRVS
ncbi:MAG: 16S rRNA methyltransferase [Acidilobaceae archaeon]